MIDRHYSNGHIRGRLRTATWRQIESDWRKEVCECHLLPPTAILCRMSGSVLILVGWRFRNVSLVKVYSFLPRSIRIYSYRLVVVAMIEPYDAEVWVRSYYVGTFSIIRSLLLMSSAHCYSCMVDIQDIEVLVI